MSRMVTFRLNRECRDIAVSPTKVLYVSHYETGASSIHFGKECFLRVQGTLAEVVGKIEAGLNDPGSEAPSPRPDDPSHRPQSYAS